MYHRVLACAALTVATAFHSVYAADRFVPSQYATIQSAIDAAGPGDHVVIAPGTYTGNGNTNVDFRGKAITIRGVLPQNPSIVGATIINCQVNSRGFMLASGETTDSVIDGLTIVNGSVGAGSAVACSVASGVTVRRCVITQCSNGAVQCGPHSTMILDRCRIAGNSGARFIAGGVNAGYLSTLTMTNCQITDNRDAGLNLVVTELLMTDCVVENNQNASTWRPVAGGMEFDQGFNQAVIRRCRFTGNHAVASGGGIQFYTVNVPCLIESCEFVGNSAGQLGGGMENFASYDGSFLVQNCTIAGNSAPQGAGVFSVAPMGQNRTTLNSCVVWGNQGGQQVEGSQTVAYSCVQGGFAGAGNINADPQFMSAASGDYRLAPGSPCIEAGDPGVVPASGQTDIHGNSRLIAARVDLGADEFALMPGLMGDVNCDNLVDLADVAPFVQALIDAAGLVGCDAGRADVDHSGTIDGQDVQAFVNLLIGG